MQGRDHYGAPYKNKQVTYDIAVVEDAEGNTVLLHLKSTNGKVIITHKEIEKEIEDKTQNDTYYSVPTE